MDLKSNSGQEEVIFTCTGSSEESIKYTCLGHTVGVLGRISGRKVLQMAVTKEQFFGSCLVLVGFKQPFLLDKDKHRLRVY